MHAHVHCKSLLYRKVHSGASNLAVRVVNLNKSSHVLIRHEDVFLEDRLHGGSTLVDTAPSLDGAHFFLGFSGLETDRGLSDDEYLLVLHIRGTLQLGLDCVLYLAFGLLTAFFVFEVEGRRNIFRQLELELDLGDSRRNKASWNSENFLLVLKEFLFTANLL